MMQIVLIGLGAGAASALLFASVASGSPLSLVLANFAQLPILIAAIGWTHLAGADRRAGRGRRPCASFSAASVGFAVPDRRSACRPGGSAIWRCSRGPRRRRTRDIEWYPVGRIVVWTAIAAGAIVIVSMLRYGLDAASISAGLRRELERSLRVFRARRPRIPGLPGSRAADRRPGAGRAADEGDRAHHHQPAQSLARGADREGLRAAAAAVAADLRR